MAYTTYSVDVKRTLVGLKKPAKAQAKSVAKSPGDPFKLFWPLFGFVVRLGVAGVKIGFFTARRIVNI